jgi:hypothetical protein
VLGRGVVASEPWAGQMLGRAAACKTKGLHTEPHQAKGLWCGPERRQCERVETKKKGVGVGWCKETFSRGKVESFYQLEEATCLDKLMAFQAF